ncbi:hypothetical protein [Teichococcus aestuarii]|uniref:hypothetical protein n=1 Tax=Teichococcus aestuarii TaxID=568898 RepID=UPI003607D286
MRRHAERTEALADYRESRLGGFRQDTAAAAEIAVERRVAAWIRQQLQQQEALHHRLRQDAAVAIR